jgi:hypothetical protein
MGSGCVSAFFLKKLVRGTDLTACLFRFYYFDESLVAVDVFFLFA